VDVQVSEVDINSVHIEPASGGHIRCCAGKRSIQESDRRGFCGLLGPGCGETSRSLQLENVDAEVKPGMTAAVTITVKQLDSVILVPNRAVRLVNNQRVVYVLSNGQTTETPITLGATADTFSEVVSGDLKEGDQVILNPPTNFTGAGRGLFGGGG